MNRRLAKLLRCLLIMAVLAGTASLAFADGDGQNQADQPDYVRLAAMLVRDGHYDRAAVELSKVDKAQLGPVAQKSTVDRPLYFTLRGIIDLKKKAYKTAIAHFDMAISYGQTDNTVFVYLAQAYYGLRDWKHTVLSVRNSEEAGRKIPDLYLMEAHAQRELGHNAQAWRTLRVGQKRFPRRVAFLRQQVFLLVEMGLYQRAAELGQVFLKRAHSGVDDYLALGEAFRRAGAHQRAKVLLEEARLRFPDNEDVLVHLAHAYIATGELIAAGELMQRAAEFDAKYVVESAELYRRAGAFDRALYMNARVTDQKAKFKQRVAIMLDRKQFDRLASMQSRLSRLGLLDDQKIVYTLAYARFKSGDWEAAERLLQQITDADLFDSAVQLRKTVQMCKAEPWRC